MFFFNFKFPFFWKFSSVEFSTLFYGFPSDLSKYFYSGARKPTAATCTWWRSSPAAWAASTRAGGWGYITMSLGWELAFIIRHVRIVITSKRILFRRTTARPWPRCALSTARRSTWTCATPGPSPASETSTPSTQWAGSGGSRWVLSDRPKGLQDYKRNLKIQQNSLKQKFKGCLEEQGLREPFKKKWNFPRDKL